MAAVRRNELSQAMSRCVDESYRKAAKRRVAAQQERRFRIIRRALQRFGSS